jgi:hypothetical protein
MNAVETIVVYRSETRYVVQDACHIFNDTHPITVVTFVTYSCIIIQLQMYKHVFASWTT